MRPILTPCKPGPRTIGGRSARVATWLETFGSEPDGPLGTLCGKADCINPEHLAHIRDMTTHCVNGHPYTQANTRWRVRKDKGETSPTLECRTCWERSKHRRREAGALGTIIRTKAKAA